jgi:hypothetical protein
MIIIRHDSDGFGPFAKGEHKGCEYYLTGDMERYALGWYRPHYPVPALRGWNYINLPDRGGGVKDDCCMIGATYIDWSRGYLEIY